MLFRSINIIEDVRPDIVLILGADHVYRMDYRQMVQSHIDTGAEFTVAAIRQPVSQSDQFGVINTDPQDRKLITNFEEKPATAQGLPDAPDLMLASMGNYVANTDSLFEALRIDAEDPDSKHDMGTNITPACLRAAKYGAILVPISCLESGSSASIRNASKSESVLAT